MDKENQLGILWYNKKKKPDGSVNTFYSGYDTKKNNGDRIFLFPNKNKRKGEGDWNLTIPVKDQTSGKDNWVTIGYLWNKTSERTEGYLLRNKTPIVTFKSQKKKERLDEAEAEKNTGMITSDQHQSKLASIRKMPDICIYFDNKDEQNLNQQNSIQRDLNKNVKVTEEEEKVILAEEDFEEEYEED